MHINPANFATPPTIFNQQATPMTNIFAPSTQSPTLGEEITLQPTLPSECVTCATRFYQDSSTDGGVSMQAATHISPADAPAAVRNHEMEHQQRDRIAAEERGHNVVLQFIELHTSLCPECNRVYVSGGMSTTQSVETQEDEAPLSLIDALQMTR